jgi:hypothetical protein
MKPSLCKELFGCATTQHLTNDDKHIVLYGLID